MVELDARNIIFGLEADSNDDCIRKIVDVMAQNGFVDPEYADYAIEREKTYPTGLPTDQVITAIPHAAKGKVYKSGIGMAIMKKPVGFYNMADHSDLLMAELVFVLANEDPDKQLGDLRNLMRCFSNGDLLVELKNSTTPEQVIDILARMDAEDED